MCVSRCAIQTSRGVLICPLPEKVRAAAGDPFPPRHRPCTRSGLRSSAERRRARRRVLPHLRACSLIPCCPHCMFSSDDFSVFSPSVKSLSIPRKSFVTSLLPVKPRPPSVGLTGVRTLEASVSLGFGSLFPGPRVHEVDAKSQGNPGTPCVLKSSLSSPSSEPFQNVLTAPSTSFLPPRHPSCPPAFPWRRNERTPERPAPFPQPEFREASSGFPVGTSSRWDRSTVPTASELQKMWLERCQDPQPP